MQLLWKWMKQWRHRYIHSLYSTTFAFLALRKRLKRRLYLWVAIALCALILAILVLGSVYSFSQPTNPSSTRVLENTPVNTVSGDWTTYMADNGRSGFNAAETIITPTTAPHLKLKWTHIGGSSIDSIIPQPIEANGLVYWGSRTGLEYATDLNNQTLWGTDLGKERDHQCSHLGVVSTATIASVQLKGTMTAVDFVGGGDGTLYALDAHSGAIIWKHLFGAPPSYFVWGSPAVYHGSVYIGISADCDNPLVQGGLVQLDAATGKLQHTFNTVPNGCVGASVWSSPTIDEAAGTIYISTGNGGKCSKPEPYAESLVELHLTDLSLLHSWQLPNTEAIGDSDFGATPTLFTTSTGIPMVGLENKNGIYYAFKRSDLSKPQWKVKIAQGPGDITSSAWDGHKLYVGGKSITVNGMQCPGSLAALNPDTGATIWRHCLPTGAIGAISAVPGLVVYPIGSQVLVLNATSGDPLFTYDSPSSLFRGWASIAKGVLYVGSNDGKLYAFAP